MNPSNITYPHSPDRNIVSQSLYGLVRLDITYVKHVNEYRPCKEVNTWRNTRYWSINQLLPLIMYCKTKKKRKKAQGTVKPRSLWLKCNVHIHSGEITEDIYLAKIHTKQKSLTARAKVSHCVHKPWNPPACPNILTMITSRLATTALRPHRFTTRPQPSQMPFFVTSLLKYKQAYANNHRLGGRRVGMKVGVCEEHTYTFTAQLA